MFTAQGILRANLTVKTKSSDICNVTEGEMAAVVKHKARCAEAARLNRPLPLRPVHLSQKAEILLRGVEAGRKSMAGTREESVEARRRFYALRRFFGSQQIFFTISPDDLKLSSVLWFAGLTKEEIEAMSATHRETVAANDPVACAQHFQHVLDVIIQRFLHFDVPNQKSFPGTGPLGKVLAFGIKIEEQHRGALHAHMLISVAGLPSTAVEMLKMWNSPDQKLALEHYISMTQCESALIDDDALVCPSCEQVM